MGQPACKEKLTTPNTDKKRLDWNKQGRSKQNLPNQFFSKMVDDKNCYFAPTKVVLGIFAEGKDYGLKQSILQSPSRTRSLWEIYTL